MLDGGRLGCPALSHGLFSPTPHPHLHSPPSCIINGQKAIPSCVVTSRCCCFGFFFSPTFAVLIRKICLLACFFWPFFCLYFSTKALLGSQKMKRARKREQRPGWQVEDWGSKGEKSGGWINWFCFVTERKLALHNNPFHCRRTGAQKEWSKWEWRGG